MESGIRLNCPTFIFSQKPDAIHKGPESAKKTTYMTERFSRRLQHRGRLADMLRWWQRGLQIWFLQIGKTMDIFFHKNETSEGIMFSFFVVEVSEFTNGMIKKLKKIINVSNFFIIFDNHNSKCSLGEKD